MKVKKNNIVIPKEPVHKNTCTLLSLDISWISQQWCPKIPKCMREEKMKKVEVSS